MTRYENKNNPMSDYQKELTDKVMSDGVIRTLREIMKALWADAEGRKTSGHRSIPVTVKLRYYLARSEKYNSALWLRKTDKRASAKKKGTRHIIKYWMEVVA
tara:strand:+ start:103 stop:408 length:306 start_codon:yes stop_codon:yes gene_type:complete